jgi:hypothetical protein
MTIEEKKAQKCQETTLRTLAHGRGQRLAKSKLRDKKALKWGWRIEQQNESGEWVAINANLTLSQLDRIMRGPGRASK